MRYIDAGGRRMSAFTLGTVQLGMDYGLGADRAKPSEEKAFAVLDRAMESGVDNLDTANNYGDSEKVIGRWLQQRREKGLPLPQITTKIGPFDHASPEALRADMLRQTERSLKTLGIDAFDCLMLHNYGTDRNYGSVNLELPDTLSLEEAGKLCRRAEARVYGQTGVILTAVGIYPYNTSDDRAAGIRDAVMHKVLSHDWVKQVHGFQVDLEEKSIRFDAVIGFDRNPEEGRAILTEDVQQLYPDFTVSVTPDVDITD